MSGVILMNASFHAYASIVCRIVPIESHFDFRGLIHDILNAFD